MPALGVLTEWEATVRRRRSVVCA